MLNKNTIIMYDFETGSRNPHTTQPVQLAAVAIEPRNLEIIPGSEFNSLIQPILDKEQQEKLGIGNIEQEALDVNGKTLEELAKAPPAKIVWGNFVKYCENYNITGKQWDAPILSGFNNRGFDDIILNRLAAQYGPFDKEYRKCSLFHPVVNLDLYQILWPWFESNYEIGWSLSMDNLRKFLGMSLENAHDALQDVKDQADILIRVLKLQRAMGKRVTWNPNKGTIRGQAE